MQSTSTAGAILIQSEIDNEIANGRLVHYAVNGKARGCSFDLTVGTIFWEGKIIALDPGRSPEQVTVPPGGVIGLFTAEELHLPDDICATAFAINALSSKGFLVVNPGHVDPGFRGALTVKALNIRKTPIVIHQGEPIFTVIFQRLGQAAPPFAPYKTREERERKFNATIVETSPRTLSQIIEADTDGPFLGRRDVEELVRTHWMSRLSLVLTIFAVVLSLIAAIASLRQLPSPPNSMRQNAVPTTESSSTSMSTDSECIAPWVQRPASRQSSYHTPGMQKSVGETR